MGTRECLHEIEQADTSRSNCIRSFEKATIWCFTSSSNIAFVSECQRFTEISFTSHVETPDTSLYSEFKPTYFTETFLLLTNAFLTPSFPHFLHLTVPFSVVPHSYSSSLSLDSLLLLLSFSLSTITSCTVESARRLFTTFATLSRLVANVTSSSSVVPVFLDARVSTCWIKLRPFCNQDEEFTFL